MSQYETNSSNVRENSRGQCRRRRKEEWNVTSEQEKEKIRKESTFAQRYGKIGNDDENIVCKMM